MTADISLGVTSLEFYQFMCQHIVGTEETVKIKRLINTIDDNLFYDDKVVGIFSGSVGEGLELKGSDLDMMLVNKKLIVHEDTQNAKIIPEKINLVMEINDVKPGFAHLRLLDNYPKTYCFNRRGKSWYFSSEMFKLYMLNDFNKKHCTADIIHGPCVSDKDETYDLAFCLHSPYWIQPAAEWINRSHASWPSIDVKSEIIGHGVLFVPIGCKGSVNEDLEWRISFSVAEKLLIYSFNHTQLLCYALMKILLKDLINSNINCKNILCSYFIKTIIFWVSEETLVTEWNPENLIQCFMRCFRRLLYCVEFSMCPHYFIPINNLFESKVEKQPQQLLLGHLNTLFGLGWRCVLLSDQLKNFSIHSNALPCSSEMKGAQLKLILSSPISMGSSLKNSKGLGYRRCIRTLIVNKSSVVKLTCLRKMSVQCSGITLSIGPPSDINKMIYTQRRTQLAYLMQNIHHDAVSGWIRVATFFYKIKHYRNALYILSYTLMKCTPDKVHFAYTLTPPPVSQNFTKITTLHRLGILRALNIVTLADIVFLRDSTLMPEELAVILEADKVFLRDSTLTPEELELKLNPNYIHFPPAVFAQFLSFLCHYHLNDTQQCCTSIRNLQVMVKDHRNLNLFQTGLSFFLFGVALQIYEEKDLAIRVFTKATEIEPSLATYAAKRSSMNTRKRWIRVFV